ncbi:MAG TPA: hypothetical protein VFL96_12665 [Acidobacteriaceae bacterium]|nr:hypothetical protein [Acidobacteriaceae bacterium]
MDVPMNADPDAELPEGSPFARFPGIVTMEQPIRDLAGIAGLLERARTCPSQPLNGDELRFISKSVRQVERELNGLYWSVLKGVLGEEEAAQIEGL